MNKLYSCTATYNGQLFDIAFEYERGYAKTFTDPGTPEFADIDVAASSITIGSVSVGLTEELFACLSDKCVESLIDQCCKSMRYDEREAA